MCEDGKCEYVFKYVEKTSKNNGSSRKYTRTDYYFCKFCLDEKVTVESAFVQDSPNDLPEWAAGGVNRKD